jgi:hypothetical protein
MWNRTALLVAVLAIVLPAFADTPETVNKATKAPVSKGSARKPVANGVEVHGYSQKVQTPVDNNSTGQPVGKRRHKPANNGTLGGPIVSGFNVRENPAPPK